jgi:NAD(P)H-flavin reductase
MSMPRKISCTVEAIIDHGGGVYTLDLTPSAQAPPFRPGQFLHLAVDEYDPSGFWPESRVFSIASSPRERNRIRICYSVKGRYTTKMEQILRPGAQVWVKLPYGDFVIGEGEDVVLLAGGTGISAFTAFVEGLKPEHPKQVWLVYGARDPSLLLSREMFFERSRQVPNLRLIFFTETAGELLDSDLADLQRAHPSLPEGSSRFTSHVSRFTGRISLDAVFSCVPQAEAKVYYISGPPIMLSALSEQLKTRGLPPAQIRTDAWE